MANLPGSWEASSNLSSIFGEGHMQDEDAWIHDGGWSHRDLKPENIFLKLRDANTWTGSEQDVKVGDFGLCTRSVKLDNHVDMAVSEDENSGEDEYNTGTYVYSAPERVHRAATRRCSSDVCTSESPVNLADIYSLGITLLELIYPFFSTGMERARVLQAFRDGRLPDVLSTPALELRDPRRARLAKLALSMADQLPERRPRLASIFATVHALCAEATVVVNGPKDCEAAQSVDPYCRSSQSSLSVNCDGVGGGMACRSGATNGVPPLLHCALGHSRLVRSSPSSEREEALTRQLVERDAEIQALRQLVSELLGNTSSRVRANCLV